MKDIYELLNDVNIDESDFDEMETTAIETAKLKKSLKSSIRKNKSKKIANWKKSAVAASIVIGLSATTLGVAFPTYAGNIPIIGDIFKFIDNGKTGLFDNYKEYSTEMNLTEENNGIAITINDAIFDGKSITLTYTIESEQDLGKDPNISMDSLQIKGVNSMAGTSRITKVADKQYVGLMTLSNLNKEKNEDVKLKWDINRIQNIEKQTEIKGNWNFALSLKATASNDKLLGLRTEKDGVKVILDKLSVSPMSFIIFYDQKVTNDVKNKWDDVYVDLQVKDDLGNSYSGEGNGGSGDGYNNSWSKTFQKLDAKATKLIVTPTVSLRLHGADNHGGVELTEEGEKPIQPTRAKGKQDEFTMNDIIIELEK